LFYYPNIIPDPEKKVAYLLIPKAGSSSIIYLILHGDINSGKIDNREEEIERAAFYFRATKLSPLPSGTEYFSVVRNPFARLVSAYLDTYKTSDSFKSNYDCYFFGLFRQEYSFTEFADCISLIPRQLLIDQLKPQQMIIKSFRAKTIRLF
tara:strand:+ start:21827 stop:22279 length:453 start_codon:yes stop_codon:yes gene_type:complete